MGKTIILNLSDIKFNGDILDVGENYGIIYSISKDAIDEIAVTVANGEELATCEEEKFDTCTMFFSLSNMWRDSARYRLIKDVSQYIKKGGELYIWDINKEVGSIFNNKVMTMLPSKEIKEFQFKNLNPISKSNAEETIEMLNEEYTIVENKSWEDIYFIKAHRN